MINLRDNEKIGYLMGWLRENCKEEDVKRMVDESFRVDNASEFSKDVISMLKDAEKQFGTYDGESLFEKVEKSNVWKSIARKFRENEKPSYTDIIFEEVTLEE